MGFDSGLGDAHAFRSVLHSAVQQGPAVQWSMLHWDSIMQGQAWQGQSFIVSCTFQV